MNNGMMIMINGQKVPVSKVKHWSFAPDRFVPNRSDAEIRQWSIFMGVKDAWERLDPGIFMKVLSPSFSYGSYWVRSGDLNRDRYQEYIKGKFDTIRRTNSGPKLEVVVLYEGLAPEQFCYALRMRQGEVTTLLTFRFDDQGLASLYMTDPQIFTFEPTFAKGGIVGADGEPRMFRHECAPGEAGQRMSRESCHAFAVECVAELFREAGAEIAGNFRSDCKEFPNIITKCGADTFYHRIDLAQPAGDHAPHAGEFEEFVAAARQHGAWPMVMPVSLLCADADGSQPLSGGNFSIKCLESRRVG